MCNNCFKFKQFTVVISIFFKLRVANQKLRFGFVKTNKILESKLTSNSFNVPVSNISSILIAILSPIPFNSPFNSMFI